MAYLPEISPSTSTTLNTVAHLKESNGFPPVDRDKVEAGPETCNLLKDVKLDIPITDLLISYVPEFLKRTGITYDELLHLLQTRFINPERNTDREIKLSWLVPWLYSPGNPIKIDSCDLNNAKIQKLDEKSLLRIHQFIRIWRKLGWKIRDVDLALSALKVSETNIALFLMELAKVKELYDEGDVNLSLASLLSFWTNIDTYQYDEGPDDSPYSRIFQNKTLINPPDFAFSLNSDRSELKIYTDSTVAEKDKDIEHLIPTILGLCA